MWNCGQRGYAEVISCLGDVDNARIVACTSDDDHEEEPRVILYLHFEAVNDTLWYFPKQPMMSLEAIIALNNRIAEEAAAKHLEPFVPNAPDDTDNWPPFPFPYIGRVPDGWEVTERFFVDKTGMGRQFEPALTIDEFRMFIYDHILDHPEDGYAIIEEGPFQVIVAAMKRTRRDLANRFDI
jgi:hypothetical protein